MRQRLFGTDGIRGKAGVSPLDPATITRIGQAFATRLPAPAPRVLLGRDTRESGPGIGRDLARGLSLGGAVVQDGGVLPTPAVAHLTREKDFAAGVVISASHNPFGDNGLKFFTRQGHKLADEDERAIELAVGDDRLGDSANAAGSAPALALAPELAATYLASLVAAAPTRCDGLELVIDCANGAASALGPALFGELGARVTTLHCSPDGRNINPEYGAALYRRVRSEVVARGAALGLAFDGDADRCILIDERGELCDGDDILAIAATVLRQPDGTRLDTVVSTVMANFGLERYLTSIGVRLVRTAVGDRHVLDAMRAQGVTLGGEQSGHILFLDHATTGDGLLTGLLVVGMMVQSGKALSALTSCWQRTPQVLRNVRVKKRVELDTVEPIRAAIVAADGQLDGRGRVLVRYSGTEPLVRVMVEGPDAAEIDAIAGAIVDRIEGQLG